MGKEKRPTWWKMLYHQRAAVESVSDTDAGSGLKAAFRYFDGEDVDSSALSAAAFTVFCVIRPYIDESKRDYEESVKNGRNGGNKRWKNQDSPPIPPNSPPIGVPTEVEVEADAEVQGFLSSEASDDTASKNGKGKTFPQDSNAYKAAALLARLILERNPELKPRTERALQRWANEIDKINRLDGYEWEMISDVLIFSQRDPFWQINILSGAKLRKQFETLYAQMKRGGSNYA